MMDRTADADNFSAHRQGIDTDLCAEGGGADTDEVGGIAVVVGYAHMIIYIGSGQFPLILLGIHSVCSEGDDDRNLFKGNIQRIMKIFHQKLAENILAHPETGHVTDDDCDIILFCD